MFPKGVGHGNISPQTLSGAFALHGCVNCDSVALMNRLGVLFGSGREARLQSVALGVLLVLGGLAIAGPSGLLAWSENLRLNDQRQIQLAELRAERDALKNRVALLDPDKADPDMVGELLRSQLNVVAPGEVVVRFDD